MMGLNVHDLIAGLEPAQRREIEYRAAELIAEETCDRPCGCVPERTGEARHAANRPASPGLSRG